jgi:hypothetical protein
VHLKSAYVCDFVILFVFVGCYWLQQPAGVVGKIHVTRRAPVCLSTFVRWMVGWLVADGVHFRGLFHFVIRWAAALEGLPLREAATYSASSEQCEDSATVQHVWGQAAAPSKEAAPVAALPSALEKLGIHLDASQLLGAAECVSVTDRRRVGRVCAAAGVSLLIASQLASPRLCFCLEAIRGLSCFPI